METSIQWHDAKEELPKKSKDYLVAHRWPVLNDVVVVRFAHYFCNRDTESGWYVDSDSDSMDDVWELGGEVLLWADAPELPPLPFDHVIWYRVGT